MIEAPFFIVGSGRSGTTLLRLILSGHSRIVIPPETWFYLDLVEQLPIAGSLSAPEVEKAVQLILDGYRWPDMGLTAEDFSGRARSLATPTLSDVMDVIYQQHLTLAQKQRFGDKTPQYISIVPQLSVLYPGARFINLIRDGHDVAISIVNADIQTRWYEGDDYAWTRAVKAADRLRKSPFSSQMLDVRYEDLVNDPTNTVKAICAFLDEEFEPDMLRIADRVELVPVRERGIHHRLREPVSAKAKDWRNILSPLECFLIEACTYPQLVKLGYPLRYSKIIWRPVLFLTGAVMRLASPLLKRGIPYLKRRGHLARWRYL